MKRVFAITLLLLSMASCKTQQKATVVSEGGASASTSVSEVIAGHYAKNKKEFTNVLINADAGYKDSKQSHNLTAEIKIKKDETILISIKFFGLTMARALITPQKVSYYEKINGTYFEGNYAVLSRWLGTELDYDKVQNILLGQAMDDLTKGTYAEKIENDLHKLSSKKGGITKEFLFEGVNYLLKQQMVAQGGQESRSLEINYPAYKEYPKATLPASVKIEAVQKQKVNIDIEYNNVKFDQDLKFQYSVPEGFEQIFIE